MATTLKMDGLEKLLKILKEKPPVARVGILGDKNGRNKPGETNASIGAQHEFGTSILPQRSFLRQPIADNMQQALNDAGGLDEASIKKIIKEGSLVGFVKKLAVLAEGIVAEGFDSGGYGKWPASDMTNKKVHMTLVETQQLRNSISSEVV